MLGNSLGVKLQLPINDLDHILDHTRDLWDDLRGERIFITGGTGFFGIWLLESFLWANQRLKLGASAVLLTRSPQTFVDRIPYLARVENVTLIAGNVRNFTFPSGTFSHFIHAATEVGAGSNVENLLSILDTSVNGTRRVLDFSLECRAKRLLFTSSGAVYGKQPVGMLYIPEDYIGAPDLFDFNSAYGQGKRQAEHLCALYAQLHAVEIKIARCFAFMGPYLPLDAHFAIGNFFYDALHGGPIVITGDGTNRRSYLYAADLAIWLWVVLFKGQSLRPYNVGSDESLPLIEVAQQVAKLFSDEVKVTVQGKANPLKSGDCYVPDISRARMELGLERHISFAESLRKWRSFVELER